ncbi:acyltransferase family protein [Mucilaginibacter sp. RCC_168]|uniref:acyltransferase family protein n=1 Tax=Mucilaginibacter sp. RCC_168 TaxID=3239221 RepID=UPI00352625C4
MLDTFKPIPVLSDAIKLDTLKKPIPVLSDAIKNKYYPSLNGIRGISIIIVVIFHLNLSSSYLYQLIFNGALGVNIFFVLSGFLITSLCLKEKNDTGSLSLTNFYIRRALRIFPAAYLYIGVIILLNHIYQLGIPKFQFAGAVFYVMNFSYFRSHSFAGLIGHYWSLSVEEQFYILFPFILKINKSTFYYIILFIVFGLPLLCVLQSVYTSLNKGVFYGFTHYLIKFQAISVGCLFSLMVSSGTFDKRWLKSTKIIGNVLAIILIFYLQYDPLYSIKAVYINLTISLITGYLIITNLMPTNDWLFKLLNTKLLSFIGVLSYSIYIWHMLFIGIEPRLPNFIAAYPVNIVGIIIVPILSYFLFEKYFLKLKTKFKPRK